MNRLAVSGTTAYFLISEKINFMITEMLNRIIKYSKIERIKRLIELAVKSEKGQADLIDETEMMLIQEIRKENGEIEEIQKERQEPQSNLHPLFDNILKPYMP